LIASIAPDDAWMADMNQKFDQVDERFDKLDDKFDRLT
jgi:hypothetical protein